MSEHPKICVIGAGSSGIAVIKALKDRGLPFDCFDKSDQIGGNWCFRNRNGMSAAYDSLHINTDCQLMQYADYPMPKSTPDYPDHRLIMDYFNGYVDHFGLREMITFETGVEHASRGASGVWEVRLDNGEIRYYDALIVANGHHWDPRIPDPPYPGKFDGVQLHSHAYLTPHEPVDCRGKRILVVGMGNSAMDIASELSHRGLADKLFLSARHGVWIMPKYLFGIPIGRLAGMPHWVPWRINSWLVNLMITLNVGKPWNYGLPRPDHPILAAHPTMSQEIYLRLGSGDIYPRPGIERLSGHEVVFTDGQRETIDVIIWCTGYKISFPFFDRDFISAPNNDLPLWERMIKPGINNLFFVGLLQPIGAIMPLAELQGKLIADHLTGHVAFPAVAQMRREMEKERKAMFARYSDRAARHTMQVDYGPYIWRLNKIRRRGARIARRRGQVLPVLAQANSKVRPTTKHRAAS